MSVAGEKTELPTQEYLSDLWEEYSDFFESEDEFQRTVALWPVCPECGKRRAVRCPICGRLGDLFPPADADFWDGVDETPGKLPSSSPKAASCGCGSGSCNCHSDQTNSKSSESDQPLIVDKGDFIPGLANSRHWNFRNPGERFTEDETGSEKRSWKISGENSSESGESSHFEAASDSVFTAKTFSVSIPNYYRNQMTTVDLVPDTAASQEEIAEKFSRHGIRLVTCSTCDEPFVPKYLSRCQECGFLFDEEDSAAGEDELSAGSDFSDDSYGRVILMAVGTILLTIFLVLFAVFFL